MPNHSSARVIGRIVVGGGKLIHVSQYTGIFRSGGNGGRVRLRYGSLEVRSLPLRFDLWTWLFQMLNVFLLAILVIGVPVLLLYTVNLLRRIARSLDRIASRLDRIE